MLHVNYTHIHGTKCPVHLSSHMAFHPLSRLQRWPLLPTVFCVMLSTLYDAIWDPSLSDTPPSHAFTQLSLVETGRQEIDSYSFYIS